MENAEDLRRNAAILEQQTAARRQYELKAAQKLKAEVCLVSMSGLFMFKRMCSSWSMQSLKCRYDHALQH